MPATSAWCRCWPPWGIAAIFLKTQLPPDNESCDGPNMVPLAKLPDLLRTLHALDRVPKETV
jgi:2-dehydro-3-deoxyphosphooctonate aldolase (KDO 8-P synthase)